MIFDGTHYLTNSIFTIIIAIIIIVVIFYFDYVNYHSIMVFINNRNFINIDLTSDRKSND